MCLEGGLGIPLTNPSCLRATPESSRLEWHLHPARCPETLRLRGVWAGGGSCRGQPRHGDNNRLIERWLEKSLWTMRGLRTGA